MLRQLTARTIPTISRRAASTANPYSKFTVKQLKDVLKSRGLPVSGRKADLVSRLESQPASTATSSSVLPIPNLQNIRRPLTSSAFVAAAERPAPDPTPRGTTIAFSAPAADKKLAEPNATSISFPDTSTDSGDHHATAPIIGNTSASHAQTGSSQAPHSADNSNKTEVSTAALSSTLQGGGPTSANNDLAAADEHTTSSQIGTGHENRGLGNFKPAGEVLARKVEAGAEKVKEGVKAVKESEETIYKQLESISGISIPSIAEAFSKQEKFEYEDRQLNAEEQRGLYVLAGILATGFLAGSLGKKSSKSKKDH